MPYLFLHGLGQGPESWAPAVEHLFPSAPTGAVLTPRLSDFLIGQKVTYQNLYQAFCQYCRFLPKPLHICGLSLGAVLALHYTIEHPEEVRSLTLIGAQYRMPRRLLSFQNAVFSLFPQAAFRKMAFEKRDLLSLTTSMTDLDFSHNLKNVFCPVLILCGEQDKANNTACRDLAQFLPRARFRQVPGCGHQVNTESPERLVQILSKFYSRMDCPVTENKSITLQE